MFVYFRNLKINYSELFQDYARNLLESGIHGAVISLDNGFDVNAFALALQIPTQNVQVKLLMPNLRHLNFCCKIRIFKFKLCRGEICVANFIPPAKADDKSTTS